MERRNLGGLSVSAVGLGCMTMTPFYGDPDPESALETLRQAPELGIDLIDTSDAYGKTKNEELIGKALKGRRERYVVATKFGNLRNPDGSPAVNARPDYVPKACEASLRRLGIETIDLYYLHRVDPTVPIEETVGAMARLVEAGKVRHIGLSEAAPKTIRRAHATHKITALQSEYSLFTREVAEETLPTCRELGIGFVAYGTLGRGLLTGQVGADTSLAAGDIRREMPRFQGENFARNRTLVGELERLAAAERCTPSQLAVAWVLQRGGDIVPIIGTSSAKRLEENAAAAGLTLSASTVVGLDAAFPPGVASGVRTVPSLLPRLNI